MIISTKLIILCLPILSYYIPNTQLYVEKFLKDNNKELI